MNRSREPRALLTLARAQLSSRAVRIRFRDTERSTIERVVDVLALAFDPPRWLAATWSARTRSLRLLDLARIRRVQPTRRRAGAPPDGFDPVHFAIRLYLDASGPPRPTTIRVDPPWTEVAPALLPTCGVEPDPGGGALLHVLASRPEIVDALAKSLSSIAAIDSASSPWPKPERRRSLTRRASSSSPPGSSTSRSPSPAGRSSRPSPTTTGASPTRRSGSSRGTRTR